MNLCFSDEIMSDTNYLCVICKKLIEDHDDVTISSKGADTINSFAITKCCDIVTEPGSHVHSSCRKRFTDKRTASTLPGGDDDGEPPASKRTSRSHFGHYDAKRDGIFCDAVVDFSGKRNNNESQKIRTMDFVNTIKQCCVSRSDEWSFIVRGRMEYRIFSATDMQPIVLITKLEASTSGLVRAYQQQLICSRIVKHLVTLVVQ